MRKIIILAAAALVLFLLSSCSLDRKNPLDPVGSAAVSAPGVPSGISVRRVTSPLNGVEITWDQLSNADGYYIYRAMSLYTVKDTVEVIEVNSITEHVDTTPLKAGQLYYYWLSAYRQYDAGKLEGKLSDFHTIRY